MKFKRFYRIAGLSVGGLIVLLLVLFVLLERLIPHIIDMHGVKTKIEGSILESTGIRANIETIKINFTIDQGAEIIFNNNILYNPEDIRVVNAGQVVVYIRYLPLVLERKTSISHIAFKNIEATIGEKGFLMNLKKEEYPSRNVVLEDTTIALNQYRIRVDRFFDGSNQYLLSGDYLVLEHYNSTAPIRLRGAGTGYFGPKRPNQRIGRFQLNIQAHQRIAQAQRFNWREIQQIRLQLEDVTLPTLANILQSQGLPLEATGVVNRLVFNYQNMPDQAQSLGIYGTTQRAAKLRLLPFQFEFAPGDLNFHTYLALLPEKQQAQLSNLHLQIKSPKFQSQVSGHLFLKTPFDQSIMNLFIKTTPLPMAGLQSLPIFPASQDYRAYRMEGMFAGRLHVTGTPATPKINGMIELRDVGLYASEYASWLVRQLDATVEIIASQTFRIHQLSGKMAGSDLNAHGEVNMVAQSLNGEIRIAHLNLETLFRLGQIFQPNNLWLKRFTGLGQVAIQLQANGSFHAPNLRGQIRILQGALTDRIRQQNLIKQVTGEIEFHDDNVYFQPLRGMLPVGLLHVSGWVRQDLTQSNILIHAPQLNLSRLEDTLQFWAFLLREEAYSDLRQFNIAGQANGWLRIYGSLSQPVYNGRIRLTQAQITYPQKNMHVSQLTGEVLIQPQQWQLVRMHGIFQAIPFRVSGIFSPSVQKYHFRLNTPEVAVERLLGIVAKLSPLSLAKIQQVGLRSGMARLDLTVSSRYRQRLGGQIYLRNLTLIPPMLGFPFRIEGLRYDLTDNRLNFPQTRIWVGQLPVGISGSLSGRNYHLVFNAPCIPLDFFRENQSILNKLLPTFNLPSLLNTAGAVTINGKIQPQKKQLTLFFEQAGFSTPVLPYPVYNLHGPIHITLNRRRHVSSPGFRLSYANTPMLAVFSMGDNQRLEAQVSGELSPLLSNLLLQQTPFTVVKKLPFQWRIAGRVGAFSGTGEGNHLSGNLHLSLAGLFPEQPASFSPNTLQAYLSDSGGPSLNALFRLIEDTLEISDLTLQLQKNPVLQATGNIQHFFSPQQRQALLSIRLAPYLDLHAIQEILAALNIQPVSGRVSGNVTMEITPQDKKFEGALQIEHLRADWLALTNLTGNIIFQGSKAWINVNNLQLPGVNIHLQGMLPDIGQVPLPVSDLTIEGNHVIWETIQEWFRYVWTPQLALWRTHDSQKRIVQPLPFKIDNASIALEEFILNNIILSNFTAQAQLQADRSFVMTPFHADVVGGFIEGRFAMWPADTRRFSLELTMQNLAVSALAQLLFENPAQIYGNLSGNLNITSQGLTRDALLANANGSANIRIENGRLPQVAKIENLLLATSAIANTLTTGALQNFNWQNLNWDMLFALATQYQTDYFATMTGAFTLNQGVLHTNDVFVNGQNLDFRAQGNLRLQDEFANLRIQARMDRDAGGSLGLISSAIPMGKAFYWLAPLRILLGLAGRNTTEQGWAKATAVLGTAVGAYVLYDLFEDGFEWNVSNITRLSAALGTLRFVGLIPPLRYLMDRIPGLGYVPGIGPLSGQGIGFELSIIGPLDDPASIQNIHWGLRHSF